MRRRRPAAAVVAAGVVGYGVTAGVLVLAGDRLYGVRTSIFAPGMALADVAWRFGVLVAVGAGIVAGFWWSVRQPRRRVAAVGTAAALVAAGVWASNEIGALVKNGLGLLAACAVVGGVLWGLWVTRGSGSSGYGSPTAKQRAVAKRHGIPVRGDRRQMGNNLSDVLGGSHWKEGNPRPG